MRRVPYQTNPRFSLLFYLQVYVGALSLHYEALSVEASKQTTAEEIVSCIVERLGLTVRFLVINLKTEIPYKKKHLYYFIVLFDVKC